MTIQDIKNHISFINPVKSEISSLGQYVTAGRIRLSYSIFNDAIEALPKDTVAFRIMQETTPGYFTQEQLWIIASELYRVPNYVAMLQKSADIIAKDRERRAKNKAASAAIKAAKVNQSRRPKIANDSFFVGQSICCGRRGEGVVTATTDETITVKFDSQMEPVNLIKKYCNFFNKN